MFVIAPGVQAMSYMVDGSHAAHIATAHPTTRTAT
jgi:hypothetical protein